VSDGCFLLDGTTLLLMWIGNAVAPEFMQEVFDVPSLRSSASSGMQLSTDDSRPTVHKINQILEQIRRQRSYTPPLYLVMQGSANDLQFTHMMREDRVENTLSHNDLLALLRNRVSQFKG
jgi:protein transport protein SEC24